MPEVGAMKIVVWAILASFSITLTRSQHIERMVLSKTRMSDLESSGSGYAYTQHQGLPASYVRYTNHGGRWYYDSPKPLAHLVAPPVAPVNLLYGNLAQAYAYARPAPVAPLLETAPTVPVETKFLRLGEEGEEESGEEGEVSSEEFRAADKWRPDAPHAGHDVAYVNDAGETYDAAKYSAHGAKGEKGYRTRNEFDEGESGAHFEDNHKGQYNDEGGLEKVHGETAGHYGHHDEEEKGAKGENYGHTKYHKKGHKTSGFHNVYRKDEYKKDTDFYDEEHESGNFEKYGSENERHQNEEGKFEKGLTHDAAFEKKSHGREGSVDKGSQHQQRHKHSRKKGDESYQRKEADFARAGGKKERKEYGKGDLFH